MTNPSVFIGSSTQGLEFARAARGLLASPKIEVTLWDEGFFALGRTFIETLVDQSSRFDFAVLVLTPDDLLQQVAAEVFSPRDNVIFELGLFMGTLGRARTFALHQADPPPKIPSDLAGVTTARFDWPRADNSRRSALGPSIDNIREVIRDLGVSDEKTSKLAQARAKLRNDLQILCQRIVAAIAPPRKGLWANDLIARVQICQNDGTFDGSAQFLLRNYLPSRGFVWSKDKGVAGMAWKTLQPQTHALARLHDKLDEMGDERFDVLSADERFGMTGPRFSVHHE